MLERNSEEGKVSVHTPAAAVLKSYVGEDSLKVHTCFNGTLVHLSLSRAVQSARGVLVSLLLPVGLNWAHILDVSERGSESKRVGCDECCYGVDTAQGLPVGIVGKYRTGLVAQ